MELFFKRAWKLAGYAASQPWLVMAGAASSIIVADFSFQLACTWSMGPSKFNKFNPNSMNILFCYQLTRFLINSSYQAN
jgi:hypothetical protein